MSGSRTGRAGIERADQRGQATIEFALVLPVVVLLLIGMVQVARITALQVATVDAARAGARAAAVDPDPAVARAAALDDDSGTVTMHLKAGTPRLVTVEVARRVEAVPLIGWSTVRLRASSTMVVEAQG